MAKLRPYTFYYGRCEEALQFYKAIFGGDYELTRVGDGPMAEQAPKEAHNMIMHAHFTSGDLDFLCADGRDVKAVDPEEGNIALCLSYTNDDEAEKAFHALAEGGSVEMPLAPAFWGGKFGILNDKFGTQWMFDVSSNAP
jgi:PhnB protein